MYGTAYSIFAVARLVNNNTVAAYIKDDPGLFYDPPGDRFSDVVICCIIGN
jgi:hypothetical protein